MSTTFHHLPIDDNGIVQGVWRLVHASPTFDRELGMVRFEQGMALSPIWGTRLKLIIAEYGGQLFLEPWDGELPRDFALADAVQFRAPEALLGRLPRAPWRTKIIDVLLPLTDELIKDAESRGQDAESHIAQFNAMLREVPTLDASRAAMCRAGLAAMVGEFSARGYVELPKALEGCITQCDAIIAGAEAKKGPSAPESTEGADNENADGEQTTDDSTSDSTTIAPTEATAELPPVLTEPVTNEPTQPAESAKTDDASIGPHGAGAEDSGPNQPPRKKAKKGPSAPS